MSDDLHNLISRHHRETLELPNDPPRDVMLAHAQRQAIELVQHAAGSEQRIRELEAEVERLRIPDGWQVVPKEPTPEHFARAVALGRPLLNMDRLHFERWSKEYCAALATAPTPPQEGGSKHGK